MSEQSLAEKNLENAIRILESVFKTLNWDENWLLIFIITNWLYKLRLSVQKIFTFNHISQNILAPILNSYKSVANLLIIVASLFFKFSRSRKGWRVNPQLSEKILLLVLSQIMSEKMRKNKFQHLLNDFILSSQSSLIIRYHLTTKLNFTLASIRQS